MTKVLVVDSLVHELPFSDAMNWETFQLFCTDLLFSRLGITNAREYLAQGSEQDGIDVYATEGTSGKLITAQCKLEKYLGPKDVDDIVELFLKGQFAVSGSEFILCTNFDLSRHRDEEATLTSARDKLGALGIVFTVWDKKGLSTELRNNPAPELLCRYFDMTIARAFYGPVYEAWIKDYRKISKLPYQENKDHIARNLTTRTDYYHSVNDPYYLYWNDRFVKLVDLIDAAKQPGKGKFLVLSIAGFGKTFEMEHIAAHYADDQEYLFPIKMYLRDYEGQSLPALLEMFCPRWKDLDPQSLLLVLDGLDEMKEVHYQTFINHLNLFCDTAEAVRVVVSTRFNFYDMANPPLRNFEILVLHPFSQQDIDEYITGRLATRKTRFLAAVKKYGFGEYLENPYYLARLVRFYDEAPAAFPASRPELFDRILFDLFDKDNSLNADALTRSEFLRVSQKIAYCMTVAGKPFLTSAQMEKLLISAGQLKVIKKYFLLNKNATSVDDWSFEHKNLQEYLCASFLQLLPLERLLEITTYPYDRRKIQTKFINTFAFLFALVDKKSEQFKALLAWLITNQQELLIRFEKERIPQPVRLEIGKSILRYYCAENLSLFAASGFSLQELADFIEIDAQVISYIDQMIAEDTGDWYAYFGIDLIGRSTKAYLIKESLTALLLKVLGNAAFSTRVHANAIDTLTRLGLLEKVVFEKILSSPIELEDSEIRNMLVLYLNSADFTEDYIDLLIETIPVFEQMENNFRQLGSSELLKKIILRSERPSSKKKILQYVLRDKSTLSLEEAGDSKITAGSSKS